VNNGINGIIGARHCEYELKDSKQQDAIDT